MFGAAVEMSFIFESVSLPGFWIRIKLHHKYYCGVLDTERCLWIIAIIIYRS